MALAITGFSKKEMINDKAIILCYGAVLYERKTGWNIKLLVAPSESALSPLSTNFGNAATALPIFIKRPKCLQMSFPYFPGPQPI